MVELGMSGLVVVSGTALQPSWKMSPSPPLPVRLGRTWGEDRVQVLCRTRDQRVPAASFQEQGQIWQNGSGRICVKPSTWVQERSAAVCPWDRGQTRGRGGDATAQLPAHDSNCRQPGSEITAREV